MTLLFGFFFALLVGNLFAVGHIDIVAFLLRHMFMFGNINVFARLVWDFLAILFVVVGGLAFFSVSCVTLLFLLIGSFGFVYSFTLLFLFIGAFFLVGCMALILVMMLTLLFLFGFTCLGLVITAVTFLEQIKEKG